MSKLSKTFKIDGVLTDMTSVVLSDPTGAYGIKRDDTDAVVVVDGTAMDHDGVGLYSYTFVDPAVDLTYTYWFEFVLDGETHRVEGSLTGPATALSTYALTTLANANEYCGASGVDSFITRLINAATAYIETYCDREFMSRTHSEWYDGIEADYLYLPHYPVTSVTRLCRGTRPCAKIYNTSTDAAYALCHTTTTRLTLVVGGGANAGSDNLLYADYATVTLLVAAVNALGKGWTGTVLYSRGGYPSADIKPWKAGRGCLTGGESTQSADLESPAEPIGEIEVEEDSGMLYMSGGITAGTRNLYVAYTGGYTTAPDDLEQVCLAIIKELYDESKSDATMQSETLGDYSYTLKAEDARIKRHLAALGQWRRIAF